MAAGVVVQYLSRPVALHAASPDPEGRRIPVVDHVVSPTLLYAVGLGQRFELDATIGAVYQTGTGAEGITAQDTEGIEPLSLRDPRLGATYGFLRPTPLGTHGAGSAAVRLALGLPLGNEKAFAGSSGFELGPSVAAALELGHFDFACELGLRLRQAVDFGGTRLGSELFSALGLRYSFTSFWSVSAQAWLSPTLHGQRHTLPDGTRVEGLHLPAEWLAASEVRPFLDVPLSFALGAGTGIPLSSEERRTLAGETESEHYLGVTTPRFRALLFVRYLEWWNER
jgi:hypothetical protein